MRGNASSPSDSFPLPPAIPGGCMLPEGAEPRPAQLRSAGTCIAAALAGPGRPSCLSVLEPERCLLPWQFAPAQDVLPLAHF